MMETSQVDADLSIQILKNDTLFLNQNVNGLLDQFRSRTQLSAGLFHKQAAREIDMDRHRLA